MGFLSTTEGKVASVALILVVGIGAVTVAVEYQRREAQNAKQVEQVIDQRGWSDGGTLHQTTVQKFKAGEARDQLATASDLLRSLDTDFAASAGDAGLKKAAQRLVKCIGDADPASKTLDAAASCRGIDLSGAPAPAPKDSESVAAPETTPEGGDAPGGDAPDSKASDAEAGAPAPAPAK